jgi:hypothetical protein
MGIKRLIIAVSVVVMVQLGLAIPATASTINNYMSASDYTPVKGQKISFTARTTFTATTVGPIDAPFQSNFYTEVPTYGWNKPVTTASNGGMTSPTTWTYRSPARKVAVDCWYNGDNSAKHWFYTGNTYEWYVKFTSVCAGKPQDPNGYGWKLANTFHGQNTAVSGVSSNGGAWCYFNQ